MEEEIAIGASKEPFIDELTRDQVGKALGLKNFPEIKKNQDQIKRLIDWAYAKGAKDTTDVVWNIKQLANRIGSPKLGNNWPQHLATYAYLEMQRLEIDKSLREMEANV